MLSRRNVRIKVMQLLFALNRDEKLDFKLAGNKYWEGIDNTYHLYLFCLYNLLETAKIAEQDAIKRKSKHLPTDDDKAFKPTLSDNAIVNFTKENKKLQAIFEKDKCKELSNSEYHEKIYYDFLKEAKYKEYLTKGPSIDEVKEILLELFRYCRKSELFNEMLEDHYPNWLDDKSVVIGAVKKTIKALPDDSSHFLKTHKPDDETVKEFGEELLTVTNKNKESYVEILKPVLENWDHDRLAILDTILIDMALSEFLHFKTIPTKVTLNEYVEIAKNYSTAKSKEFINGILDKLLKSLDKEGKINKEGRGLID
jgi:N utilization substance protein B